MTLKPEVCLKRYLHYGSEDVVYRANGSRMYETRALTVIAQLLSNDDTKKTIVPAIVKAAEDGYSIEPRAMMYALATTVRESVKNKDYRIAMAAYKAAKKLSSDSSELFLLFSHFLRELAKKEGFRGFGAGWRKTVTKWYDSKDGMELARIAYNSCATFGWDHKKVLAMCRYKDPVDKAKLAVIKALRRGVSHAENHVHGEEEANMVMHYMKAVDLIRSADDEYMASMVLKEYDDFGIRHVPSTFLHKTIIWLTAIPKMSIATLVANINLMGRYHMLRRLEVMELVLAKLNQYDETTDMDVQPIHIYIVGQEYALKPKLALEFKLMQDRGRAELMQPDLPRPLMQRPPRVIPEIAQALIALFYKTFASLAPSGLKYLIVFDHFAAKKNGKCGGNRFITVIEAQTLIGLCALKSQPESNVKFVTFGDHDLKEMDMNKVTESLKSMQDKLLQVGGAGRPSLKKLFKALCQSEDVFDVIVVLGDNALNCRDHEVEFDKYKEKNPNGKVIVCSFTGINQPSLELIKNKMFAICGFDKHVWRLIEGYSRGAF